MMVVGQHVRRETPHCSTYSGGQATQACRYYIPRYLFAGACSLAVHRCLKQPKTLRLAAPLCQRRGSDGIQALARHQISTQVESRMMPG
jgi:hypothetical protein